MEIEEKLKQETKKWLEKIKEKRKTIVAKKRKDLVDNIEAYISDAKHFMAEGQYVKAFEAVVWAWAWMEILEELGIVEMKA